ncbi:aromatic acid exporter family protein [Streptomyces albus]|nr:aromatic acid exporter family protein [Streptomyces albus]
MFRHPGHERNLVLLVLKSALAATVSWWLAKEVLDFESPAFAPFSALLAVNTTVDTSIRQALRYTAAVTVGVTVQAVAGFLLGPGLSVFLVVALVALAIGQWKGLGEQSAQVPTAAFFAFSAFTSASTTLTRATMLGEIVALVLVGCGIGLVVNVCLAPPLRYRSAEQGLRSFACEIRGLLRAVAEGLEAGEYAPERTREWRAEAASGPTGRPSRRGRRWRRGTRACAATPGGCFPRTGGSPVSTATARSSVRWTGSSTSSTP